MNFFTTLIDLIAERPLIWGLFLVYMVGTSYLAWLGHKKTQDLESFAVGKGDMNPWMVGVTLAASIASTATFVINPGFVYVHGLSAFMHLGVAAGLGIVLGLLIMSLGFRRIGVKTKALTLPHWLGERFQSRAMTVFFALVNLLTVTFVVLIVGGLSIVMQQTLGLTNVQSLILIIGFVFSYIFVGGTYAHAYTNTFQGLLMVVIAGIIVASGFPLLADGLGAASDVVAAQNPNLVLGVNPESPLFGTFFSVYVSGFVIGFALVSQPHIMIKAMYVESDSDVWKYLGVTIGVSVVFTALLFVGFYAHLAAIPADRFVDAATGAFRQDMVMTVYITETFSPTWVAIITVALLAAGMSTLDGLLIALSSITANDLFLNLTRNNLLAEMDEPSKLKAAHRAGQLILIALGVVTFIIALDPPKLLGIFGQVGVYGIIAASAAPILFGIIFESFGKIGAFASAITGLGVHLALYLMNMNGAFDASWGFANPGVTATYAIFGSVAVCLLSVAVNAVLRREEPGQADAADSSSLSARASV